MKKFLGLLVLLAIAAGFIFIPKLTKKSAAPAVEATPVLLRTADDGLNVGEVAPDFKLKNVDGRMISLADVKNADGSAPKGFIVTFTCNTCPYAVMYEDRIIDLHNKYASKGWHVVAIQPNDPELKPGDSFEEMKVRAKEKSLPYFYLFDDGQKVYPQFGASRTPHIYLLDNTRKVRYIGAIDNNPQDAEAATERYVENAIAAMEAGKEPNPNFTKAIGCGIKAK